jgi:hypothetical protein
LDKSVQALKDRGTDISRKSCPWPNGLCVDGHEGQNGSGSQRPEALRNQLKDCHSAFMAKTVFNVARKNQAQTLENIIMKTNEKFGGKSLILYSILTFF